MVDHDNHGILCRENDDKNQDAGILGWLISGMVLGPHALGLLGEEILSASWYHTLISLFECSVGIFIGTELVIKKIKKSGKQIVVTTLTQSLGTFVFVTLVFALVFYFMEIPLYLAVIFGGIALATAPAPALSVVREFNTDGPVTKTLIPMAALDDVVAVIVFISVISTVAARISTEALPAYIVPAMVLLPFVIGLITGWFASLQIKRQKNAEKSMMVMILFLLLTAIIGFMINHWIFGRNLINFMLMGMAYSAMIANKIDEEKMEEIKLLFSPILGVSLLVVILNLGAPLDYHLILGAGLFTPFISLHAPSENITERISEQS